MKNTECLKQKRKKKQSRKIFRIIIGVLLIIAIMGVFFYQKKKTEAQKVDENSREAVVLEKNQSWQQFQIENIVGNEMVVIEIEENGISGGEAKNCMIPVGTEVVTKLGSVTTFSRLAAGDKICCLMQDLGTEEMILKIWIEE